MALFKNKFDTLFFGFLISIIIVFLFFRPLNSPWHKFIAGDGFGYYSYLPATYIYNDTDYSFKWFNKIYKANYVYESFPNPEDNFLVAYNNKRINKYYQGLSYIWLPFFGVAHLVAKFFNYPADGFSQPYQLFIGFASIFYLIIGLVYLRKIGKFIVTKMGHLGSFITGYTTVVLLFASGRTQTFIIFSI